MSRRWIPGLCLSLLTLPLLCTLASALAPPPAKPAAPVTLPDFRVSGPFTEGNLTVFFLHGKDQLPGKKILTLDEALKAKKVIVHETKNVNELSIENVSDQEVFVQAGDIVKGGQQDRTLALDVLVPAKSGKIPVSSFCVEQGRWNKRGPEDDKKFDSSSYALAGNRLKLAARLNRSQRGVWMEVESEQKKLMDNLKAEVKDAKSVTSYQLTLENKTVLESIDKLVKKLQGSLDDKATDVVGYAVAINGKVNNADVYANADLFRKLWPKLLRASAVEAVGEQKEGLKVPALKAEAVTEFLKDAASGKQSERATTLKDLKEVQNESSKNILIQTQTQKGQILRQSYLAK